MYQFSEMFKEMQVLPKVRTYRVHGLLAGVFLGWLPAWGTTHWLHKGGWVFALTWIGTIPLGYGLGKLIRKK